MGRGVSEQAPGSFPGPDTVISNQKLPAESGRGPHRFRRTVAIDGADPLEVT